MACDTAAGIVIGNNEVTTKVEEGKIIIAILEEILSEYQRVA